MAAQGGAGLTRPRTCALGDDKFVQLLERLDLTLFSSYSPAMAALRLRRSAEPVRC